MLDSIQSAREGLKFAERTIRLKNPNQIATWFSLAGRRFTTKFNNTDLAVLQEEHAIQAKAEELRANYGSIELIPANEIEKNGFSRILLNKKWKIFKSLSTSEGAVIIS